MDSVFFHSVLGVGIFAIIVCPMQCVTLDRISNHSAVSLCPMSGICGQDFEVICGQIFTPNLEHSFCVLYRIVTINGQLVPLNGTAPSYLAKDLRRLSDMPSRRRLRSSLTHQLDIRQTQCATVGDRAFATAGARLWNSLPADIVACDDTLPQFHRELKTFLFRLRLSYPSILL